MSVNFTNFQTKIIIFLVSDTAYRFFGNHTHTDYFKLLRKDGQSLLIGARNVIYNISLPYLQENVEQVMSLQKTLCTLKQQYYNVPKESF